RRRRDEHKKPEPTISAEKIREYIEKEKNRLTIKSNSYNILAEYYEKVDPKLLNSGIAYRPAKSVEMGKVDQPMIGHIRNGVWAIVELNEVLGKLGLQPLDDIRLKEVVALFVSHDIHKLNGKNWKEQFDISEKEVSEWAEKFGLFDFAPGLNAKDYQSVAVAQHASMGFHSNLSAKFTLYKPWTDVADTLASIEVPMASESMQKQLDQIDGALDFYYHTFNEATGILSNLVHTGIASWAKRKGLIALLIFEKGIVYVGKKGIECKLNSAHDIEEIYEHFKEKLNKAHPAITEPNELSKSIISLGEKGLFKLDNVNFYCAGLDNVIKAFLGAAVLKNDDGNRKVIIDIENHKITADNKEPDMQYPPADVIDIPSKYITSVESNGKEIEAGDIRIYCANEERKKGKYNLIPQSVEINGKKADYSKFVINGTGLNTSQVGYRLHLKNDFGIDIGWSGEIISYSRAISGIRMQFVDQLIKLKALETVNPVLETCKMFKVDKELTQKLSDYAEGIEYDHHVVGGFWNYSYVIARDILDRNVNGIKFKNISDIEKVRYIEKIVFEYIDKIPDEKWIEFEKNCMYPYKDKMLVWISENLDFNKSMVYGKIPNKINKFDAYLNGEGICKLTNDTLYDSGSPGISQDLSMLKYTYSNRLPIGAQNKIKLEVSVPVEIEFALRQMGHKIKDGDKKIYYKLIPDHFYTPLLSEMFSETLAMFDGNSQTNIRGIAQDILSSDACFYHITIKELASEFGQKILRYSGNGFRGLFSTYDIVFNMGCKKKDTSSRNETQCWFMCTYLGMILAATTGCRVVVGENPICTTRGDEFKEIIKFDSPYASVKRIFGDRISLSELNESILLASLIISLGYEYEQDDGFMPKHLQKLRTHLFPGSAILKEIHRQYEKDQKRGGIGTFINKARGFSKNGDERIDSDHIGLIEQAIKLDKYGVNKMAVESIHELAALGLRVAVPKAKGMEPYRIEKLFRESTKAVIAKKLGNFKREDFIDAVSGRLLKMMKRAGDDQFYYKSGLYDSERTLKFAEAYVDFVFYKIADGQTGKLKQKSNDLSDGFYAATLYQWESAFNATKAEIEAAKAEKNGTEVKK
ncbi:MAG: type I-D CRISPR-associated protein Cas10d/Csc3, partial [Ruminiclostridium sp.]|nr:type I-D CRISPR-associated protein Cas10d/Csc3 [Ruminiclostridium sp.]